MLAVRPLQRSRPAAPGAKASHHRVLENAPDATVIRILPACLTIVADRKADAGFRKQLRRCPRRPGLKEAVKYTLDRLLNLAVRIPQKGLSLKHEPGRNIAVQSTAKRFVALAAIQARADDRNLRGRYSALDPQNEIVYSGKLQAFTNYLRFLACYLQIVILFTSCNHV